MRSAKTRRIVSIIVGVLAVAIVAFLAVGLIWPGSWPGRLLRGTTIEGAHPEYIPPKPAVSVDGNAGEWAGDAVYAEMYRAGNPNKPVEAYLFLRYECATSTLFAYVASAGSWPLSTAGGTSESWIRINGSKVNFTNFAWINESGGYADGFEASFSLAEGDYTIEAHTNTYHDGESQTAGSTPVSLTVLCGQSTAVFINYFEAAWSEGGGRDAAVVSSSEGGVVLRWETATEIDNLGFNVFRGARKDGPWEQLNRSLIPSQVPPGSPVGATYEWTDTSAVQGQRYFYLLEDVDTHGVKIQHGPVAP